MILNAGLCNFRGQLHHTYLCACLTSLFLLLLLSTHLYILALLSGLFNCNSWTVLCVIVNFWIVGKWYALILTPVCVYTINLIVSVLCKETFFILFNCYFLKINTWISCILGRGLLCRKVEGGRKGKAVVCERERFLLYKFPFALPT